MVSAHLLDSLAVLPHLPEGSVLDVGTGAGFPGIPLAIACPERRFTLLDCIDKKTSFLRQVVGELGLTNVDVVTARVEQWQPGVSFDCLISRAYAEIVDFIGSAQHLLANGGRFAAMKGRMPTAELEAIPEGYQVESIVKLSVPGLSAERHLVLVKRR